MIKAEFSASLLQSHDPPEIILICWSAVQETFIIIIITIKILNSWVHFILDSLMNRKIQRSVFIWNKKAFVTLYTIPFRSLESAFSFFFGGGGGGVWKLILLLSKDALSWSKVMIKTFIMLQKISISDKCCSSELSIHQWNLKKINLLRCFQHNNNNNKSFFEQQIRIFEWFQKDHVTAVMMLKIQLWSQE